MPVLGLGVWQLAAGVETERAVGWALEAGYRHFDTASVYRNEESVGVALKQSGLPSEQVFVTTKLMPARMSARRELEKSLQRLGLEYVDLYLIHWPLPFRSERVRDLTRSGQVERARCQPSRRSLGKSLASNGGKQ